MLKRRIIPCLDVKNGRVVKGVHFKGLRDAGDPIEAARAYDAQGADELCLLDITAIVDGHEATACWVLGTYPRWAEASPAEREVIDARGCGGMESQISANAP